MLRAGGVLVLLLIEGVFVRLGGPLVILPGGSVRVLLAVEGAKTPSPVRDT